MKIFDCFTLFNELDLLEFRIKLLYDYVDYFVISESNLTHSGLSKPYNYYENHERYKKWSDKIIYYPIEQTKEDLLFEDVKSYSPKNGSWILENQQRLALSLIKDIVNDEDIILISDLDEIPIPEVLQYIRNDKLKEVLSKTPVSLVMLFHYYYMNCQNIGYERNWSGTVVSNGYYFKQLDSQILRDNRNNYPKLENSGYHFSFLNGLEAIKTKIKAFAHTEFNRPDILSDENIIKSLEEGKDIFNRPGVEYKFYSLDYYPENVRKIMLQYPQFIKLK